LVFQTFEFTHNGKEYKELSAERQEERGCWRWHKAQGARPKGEEFRSQKKRKEAVVLNC
jgi:hypothetical protein